MIPLRQDALHRGEEVDSTHSQRAAHYRIHLQGERGRKIAALGRVCHLERRWNSRYVSATSGENDVGGCILIFPTPQRLVAAEAGVDIVEDMRRRLMLQVLVQGGALPFAGRTLACRACAASSPTAARRRRIQLSTRACFNSGCADIGVRTHRRPVHSPRCLQCREPLPQVCILGRELVHARGQRGQLGPGHKLQRRGFRVPRCRGDV
eukprot:2015016-Prymnesium_polylepis.1